MKKLIYIFFFLFSFFFLLSSSFSQTNIYHPFPDSNAVWYVFSSNSQGWTNYSNYSIIGDTVIENKTYHKLYSNSIYYTGAYRNVDSLQKVYFVPYNDTTETVFYDFDVNIGDTIDFYPSILCCGLKPIVYNIDTIYIKSIPRKRITVSSCSFLNHYIEGIGCTGDLVSGEFCFEGEASLECFFQNGMSLYPDTGLSMSYCSSLGINEKNKQEYNFSIYPNPSNGILNIEYGEKFYGQSKITIYNILGILVYSVNNNPKNIVISLLPKGIYFLQYINGDSAITEKIILY